MAGTTHPTIKGFFVNSHIKALRDKCGAEGLQELADRLHQPVGLFRNSDFVPVSVESEILEHCVEILTHVSLPDGPRAFEAGRLHFRNFLNTGMGRILMPVLRNHFEKIVQRLGIIVRHVFKGMAFVSEVIEPGVIRVRVMNDGYPLAHFQGFFKEWMAFALQGGRVEARDLGPNYHEYHLIWEKQA